MSIDVALVVIGVVLCVIGLAMWGSSRSIVQKNIGFNFGSTSTQTNTVGEGAVGDKRTKASWVGLAIAVLGFLTAVIGLFTHLM